MAKRSPSAWSSPPASATGWGCSRAKIWRATTLSSPASAFRCAARPSRCRRCAPPCASIRRDRGAPSAGRLTPPRAEVPTPAFMPVATQGAVKALAGEDLLQAGAMMLLANAYHLYLRPGSELVRRLGGLHRFMAWPGPILADSGGFQVFSLGPFRRVSEEGGQFVSHWDGTRHLFP